MKKLNNDIVNSRLEPIGFKLAQKFENVDCKTNLTCSCGNGFVAILSNVFHQGIRHRGCGACSRSFNMSLEEIRLLSLSKGFEFLDSEYRGNTYKHNFRCSKHNEIHICTIKSIKMSRGLKCCIGEKLTLSEDFVMEELSKRGFLLIETYTKYNNRHLIKCNKHGEEFLCKIGTILQKRKIGCRSCRAEFYENKEYKTGKDHFNYDHSKTDEERQKGRNVLKGSVSRWRRLVLKTTGAFCKCCRSEERLVVHHIRNWSDNKDLRVDISNGCVLCYKCHRLFHKTYGNRNTNEIQLDEFKNIIAL